MSEQKKRRGFAVMSLEERRRIASMGGRAVPHEKRSFSRNKVLASVAGVKGGKSVKADNRAFSQNKELAIKAGRKGGLAAGRSRRRLASDK